MYVFCKRMVGGRLSSAGGYPRAGEAPQLPAVFFCEIVAAAKRLFLQLWQPQKRPVRLIGVGMSALVDAPRQPSLWEAEHLQTTTERQEHLNATMAQLRGRFGQDVVRRGTELLDPTAHDSP